MMETDKIEQDVARLLPCESKLLCSGPGLYHGHSALCAGQYRPAVTAYVRGLVEEKNWQLDAHDEKIKSLRQELAAERDAWLTLGVFILAVVLGILVFG